MLTTELFSLFSFLDIWRESLGPWGPIRSKWRYVPAAVRTSMHMLSHKLHKLLVLLRVSLL